MAIGKICKANIFVYGPQLRTATKLLQKSSLIDVISEEEAKDHLAEEITGLPVEKEKEGIEAVDNLSKYLSDIDEAIGLLKNYEVKKGVLEKVLPVKIETSWDDFEKSSEKINFGDLASELADIRKNLLELKEKKQELANFALTLSPWLGLDFPLSELWTRPKVRAVCGIVPHKKYPELLDALGKCVKAQHVEEVESLPHGRQIILFAYPKGMEDCLNVLREFDFEEAKLHLWDGKPSEEYGKITEEAVKVLDKEQGLSCRLRDLSENLRKLRVLRDHYSSEKTRREAERNFRKTDKVYVICGWVERQKEGKLRELVENKISQATVSFSEPAKGEEVPVVLKNAAPVSPFEMLTKMFSLPNYAEIDPTPLLMPFFVVFFGICLTDAGYGIIIFLFSLAALVFLRLPIGSRQLFKILLAGGLASVAAGILTGSWFGIETNLLHPHLRRPVIIEPLKNPAAFLNFSLAAGFLQVWFGLFVNLMKDVKKGEIKAAFLDDLPWFVLIPALGGLVISATGAAAVKPYFGIFKWAAIVSSGFIVVFSNRSIKNFAARLGAGLYSLYGVSGYLGDVLSYSRLMAFGLTTAGIAMVVNKLAAMTYNAVPVPVIGPVIGAVFFLLVLVVGHAFNLLINSLGGFVHTLRLQYIEFFTKFFEGGGKPFKPFAPDLKYTVIEKE